MTMNNPAIEALKEAKAVLEFLHPLIKVAGVPPMSRKIGVMCGIATSGAHKIKHVLPIIDAALTPAPAVDASTAEHLRKLVYAAKWATTQGFEATIKDVEYLEQKLKAALSAVDVPADETEFQVKINEGPEQSYRCKTSIYRNAAMLAAIALAPDNLKRVEIEIWIKDFPPMYGPYFYIVHENEFGELLVSNARKTPAPPAPTTKPQPQNDPNSGCEPDALEEQP